MPPTGEDRLSELLRNRGGNGLLDLTLQVVFEDLMWKRIAAVTMVGVTVGNVGLVCHCSVHRTTVPTYQTF